MMVQRRKPEPVVMLSRPAKHERQLRVKNPHSSGEVAPSEVVAAYFRALASRGQGCATNNHSVGMKLGLSVQQVVTAKRALIDAGRLVGRWSVWQSIDGHPFSGARFDDLEELKNALRRHRFSPVCDARVVENPGSVPRGPVTHLLVGDRRLTLEVAAELIETLDAKAAK